MKNQRNLTVTAIVRNKQTADRNRRKAVRDSLSAANIKARTVYLTVAEQPLFDRAIAHLGNHILGPATALLAYKTRAALITTGQPPTPPDSIPEASTKRDASQVEMAANSTTGSTDAKAPAPSSDRPLSSATVAPESVATSVTAVADELATAETRQVATSGIEDNVSDAALPPAEVSDLSRPVSEKPRKERAAQLTAEFDFGGGTSATGGQQ